MTWRSEESKSTERERRLLELDEQTPMAEAKRKRDEAQARYRKLWIVDGGGAYRPNESLIEAANQALRKERARLTAMAMAGPDARAVLPLLEQGTRRQADRMISVDPGHLIAMERRIAELEVALAEAEISALFAAVEAGLINTRAAGVTP